MKTNVPIELTDEERDRLANVLDGKTSKRLATRAEVCAAAETFIRALVAHELAEIADPEPEPAPVTSRDLYTIPDKWRDRLRGKSDAYIRGFLNADRQINELARRKK